MAKKQDERREERRPKKEPRKLIKKKFYIIPKIGMSRAAELKIYYPLAAQFKVDNPICQCGRNRCRRKTTDVHHKKGREGEMLLVMEFWLAVARVCHTWINEHPEEAEVLGLTISRLKKYK